MPAVQVDVVRQQRFKAVTLHAANDRRFVFPEITVMHDHRIRLQTHRFIQQRLACRDAGDNFLHRFTPFHLQAVGTVVAEAGAVQLFID
ncbi:hypothetical protein D3C86_1732840 [compost metagenome]